MTRTVVIMRKMSKRTGAKDEAGDEETGCRSTRSGESPKLFLEKQRRHTITTFKMLLLNDRDTYHICDSVSETRMHTFWTTSSYAVGLPEQSADPKKLKFTDSLNRTTVAPVTESTE